MLLKSRTYAMAAVAVALFVAAGSTFAQGEGFSKAKGNYGAGFQAGSTRQSAARGHARVIYNYGHGQPQVSRAIVKDNVQAIRSNLQGATKDFQALKEAHKDNAEVAKLVDSIVKHHNSALEKCDMVEGKGDGAELESSVVCDCCADMTKDLHAAEEAAAQLGKLLKIEKMMDPLQHKAHAAPKR
ncbi:MAG: hypothetical protein SFX18_02615 [Pirellulales bacterium]|nr:hypothetical protein [Pirellulales bacterium]